MTALERAEYYGVNLDPYTEAELEPVRRAPGYSNVSAAPGYLLIDVLCNRVIVEDGVTRPSTTHDADEHGILGGNYRIEAAAAACALGLLMKHQSTLVFSGAGGMKAGVIDEPNVYVASFDEMMTAKGLPIPTGLTGYDGGIWSPDMRRVERRYTDAGTIGNINHFFQNNIWGNEKKAVISNWFHLERLMAIVMNPGIWPDNPSSVIPGSGLVDLKFDQIIRLANEIKLFSAERLVITAFGEERRQEIAEAYFGDDRFEDTILRTKCEAAGIQAIQRGSYELPKPSAHAIMRIEQE